ncbi:MAG: SLC13 family permease [Verrucomicrobiales bacterium]
MAASRAGFARGAWVYRHGDRAWRNLREDFEVSGGAESIARSLLGVFGKERASWAMAITGFLISIPVFLDVGLVIVIPIIYSLARDANKSLLYYGIPPLVAYGGHPRLRSADAGTDLVAAYLEADLGLVILTASLSGCRWRSLPDLFLKVDLTRMDIKVPHYMETEVRAATGSSKGLPSFGLILIILGLPLALMVAGSVISYSDRAVAGKRQRRQNLASGDEGIADRERSKHLSRKHRGRREPNVLPR